MYNDNALQKIGDTYYVYGTPIKKDGDTVVKFPDGKEYVVLGIENNDITYSPKRGGGYDKNFVYTKTYEEVGNQYGTFSESAKMEQPKIPGLDGTKAIEKREDGYYYVYGTKVDLNNKETMVKFPNGITYAVQDIKDGKITYAPRGKGWTGIFDETKNEYQQTQTFEEMAVSTNPVKKDGNGNVTVFGAKAEPGAIVFDGNGKFYVVDGVDGDNVVLTQAEYDLTKGVTKIGKTYEISTEGIVGTSNAGVDALNPNSTKNTQDPAGQTPTAEKPNSNIPTEDKPVGGPDNKPDNEPDGQPDALPEENPTDIPDGTPPTPDGDVIKEPNPEEKAKPEPEKERINEMSSRADNYAEVRTLEDDYYHDRGQGNDKATYGAKDRGDVKDQDKALEDIEGRYKDKIAQFNNGDGIIHKGEGISHHHHQTYTDDYKYGDTDVTYLPGQLIELAGDPTKVNEVEPFRTMYQENIDKNILGDGFNIKDGQKISRIEYAAALASSGKYSMQDLFGTADALGDDKFGFYEGPYFKGTQFEKWAEENKDKDYQQMEEELTNDVKDIIGGWQEVHKLLEEMSGEAVDAEGFYTAQCIQGKFEVAMGNINDRLKPACLAINLLLFNSDASSIAGAEGVKIPPNQPKNLSPEFVPGVTANTPLMEQLKLGEEALNNLLGTGSSPEPINRKQLLEDIDTAQTRLNGWQQEEARHGHCPVPSTTVDAAGAVTGDNSSAISAWKARDAEIKKYITQWKEELEKLNKQFEELEEKIKAFRTELNAILEYSMILLDFIKKYDTYRGTYRSYVLPGANGQNSDIYNWIHSKDIEVLKKNHDAIIHGFEDYDKMPVISNKSDYTVGDVVLYDDAHGYTYVVKGYDPLTGQLIIACIDKDGKQIGSDIIVMDQREITPARQDIFEDEYPLPTIPSTVIDSTPDTRPRSTKPRPPVPSTTTPPVPSTTTPPVPSTTTPPVPSTTRPPVPSTTRPPEPTPTVIIYTTPPPPPGPTPTGPYGPYSPHTGLDAIYGTGETKQSSTGLGALAGLAAGAAGLGLTGLIGDKKDEEEEEEEDSTLQMTEENKPLEHVEDKKEETKENDFSDPQFF